MLVLLSIWAPEKFLKPYYSQHFNKKIMVTRCCSTKTVISDVVLFGEIQVLSLENLEAKAMPQDQGLDLQGQGREVRGQGPENLASRTTALNKACFVTFDFV
jgi:hypothetical protein